MKKITTLFLLLTIVANAQSQTSSNFEPFKTKNATTAVSANPQEQNLIELMIVVAIMGNLETPIKFNSQNNDSSNLNNNYTLYIYDQYGINVYNKTQSEMTFNTSLSSDFYHIKLYENNKLVLEKNTYLD